MQMEMNLDWIRCHLEDMSLLTPLMMPIHIIKRVKVYLTQEFRRFIRNKQKESKIDKVIRSKNLKSILKVEDQSLSQSVDKILVTQVNRDTQIQKMKDLAYLVSMVKVISVIHQRQ